MIKLGIGATVLSPALSALLEAGQSIRKRNFPIDSFPEAQYYKKLPDGRIQCTLCPNLHIYKEGEVSFCRTRQVYKGKLITLAYNNPCTINLDPIEKGPFNHIRPGTNVLALASGGCNLRCLYCQNWDISQSQPNKLNTFDLPKEESQKALEEKECKAIMWTYTEPTVYPEYIKEIAGYTAAQGVRNLICTAGFVNPEPLKDLCKTAEGFAVALKAFDEDAYIKIGQQSLKPVLKSLETIKAAGKWLEVVNLIVPTYNDDMGTIKEMCNWLKKNLGAETPLHFGRFVPEYKLKTLPPTPLKTIEQARQTALDEGLKFVYTFNVAPHEGNNTYCPKCGKPVIKRLAFKILENNIKNGACGYCGEKILGTWA